MNFLKWLKADALYWDVMYKNSKGFIKQVRIKANDEIELMTNIKRTFIYAEVIDFRRV